jgi:adsorption protein B
MDDLIPLAILLRRYWRNGRRPIEPSGLVQANLPESKIAIFVPCWKESGVIGNMVRHNLTAIRYRNFDIFLGAYPNDEPTVAVGRQLAETFGNVHVAVCPDPGPTSKADCLNSIYHQMQAFEKEQGVRFNTVVLHDAEDLIHPEALSLINRERARYDMVQVPVLPLPTPFFELMHGVYCDEFAEFQHIDMHARIVCAVEWSRHGLCARDSGAAGVRARRSVRCGEPDGRLRDWCLHSRQGLPAVIRTDQERR